MDYPGTWMTESGQILYRVVPKCACSTIGQIMFYADQGRFFDGDIHDAEGGMHKWQLEQSQPVLRAAVEQRTAFAFTCVRNPFARVLSSFFDKICGIQRSGRRYRGNLVPRLVQEYGIEVGGEDGQAPFDQIASFRRFLLFARDSIRFRKPMDPDIHWSAMSSHLGTFVGSGGRFDLIFPLESFNEGMQKVLEARATPHPVVLSEIPRFNESADHGPKRAHPVADYYDDLSHHLITEIYKRDFELFGYDLHDPARLAPSAPIDLERVHRVLAE